MKIGVAWAMPERGTPLEARADVLRQEVPLANAIEELASAALPRPAIVR